MSRPPQHHVNVGLFDRFKRNTIAAPAPAAVGMVTPFESAKLARIAWAEHFGDTSAEVNRNSAMRIPAIAKARNTLVGIIASLQLRELNGEEDVTPAWLYRTDTDTSPWHRLAWSIDDLIFWGFTLWIVERNSWTGQIIDAARVPYELWSVDQWTGDIRVNGEPVPASRVLLIPGSFEGIIEAGYDTIKGAQAVQRAWVGRAQNPIPLLELHQATDDELEPEEIDELMAAFSAARTAPTGAVAFTDHRIDVRVHGEVNTDLFEEGRNAVVLDIARLTGLPASLLDGSQSTASLTYSTQEGNRNEFIDYSLPMWLSPIEARLSMDDVCTPGNRIRFDKSSLTSTSQDPISDPIED